MCKLQHTKGPWEACSRGDYTDFDGNSQVILGNDMRIGVVHSYDIEGEANARLIAAAPEMLELLIDLCIYNCSGCSGKTKGCSGKCGLNIIPVIEKATGLKIEEVLSE